MVSITLGDRDQAILDRLRRGDADVETLSESVAADTDWIRDRLPELADNGLVRRVDDGYAITESGERAMAGSPAGRLDDRIDTTPDVEEALESFDLRADRADAVRGAFAFLAYWGEATDGEIVDAVYSETPAGFDDRETWWTELVRDRLADLPRVDPPAGDDEPWRYAGTPTADRDGADGRAVSGDDVPARSSAKAALAGAALGERERDAVRAAFEHLLWAGEATADEFRAQVYPGSDAGYESAAEWWDDCVRDELERLPGVGPEAGDTWVYRQTTEGLASTPPGTDGPGEHTSPGDDTDE